MINSRLLELLTKSLIDAWMTEGVGFGLHSKEEEELDAELIKLIDSDNITDETNNRLKTYYKH